MMKPFGSHQGGEGCGRDNSKKGSLISTYFIRSRIHVLRRRLYTILVLPRRGLGYLIARAKLHIRLQEVLANGFYDRVEDLSAASVVKEDLTTVAESRKASADGFHVKGRWCRGHGG